MSKLLNTVTKDDGVRNNCTGEIAALSEPKILDKALAKKSIEIKPVLEVGRTDIITELLVGNSDKVSYLPDFVTREKVEKGELVFLNVKDIETDIWKQLIYHKNKWVSKSLSALIEYIKINEYNN